MMIRTLALLPLCFALPAGAQQFALSVDAVGNCGAGNSTAKMITPDGRYSLFTTNASNLPIVGGGSSTGLILYDHRQRTRTKLLPNSSANLVDVSGTSYVYLASSPSTIRVKNIASGVDLPASTDAAGNLANGTLGASFFVSSGARYVLFNATSNNLVANDTNNRHDVFLKDMLTGAIKRVSERVGGGQLTDDSYALSITPDGSLYVFESRISLVTGQPMTNASCFIVRNPSGEIVREIPACGDGEISADGQSYFLTRNFPRSAYRVDIASGVSTRIDFVETNQLSNDNIGFGFSRDGKWLCWSTPIAYPGFNDMNNTADIYFRRLSDAALFRASVNNTGIEANMGSTQCSIANGGAAVLFNSQATNFACTEPAGVGDNDVFLLDRDRIFLGRFEP